MKRTIYLLLLALLIVAAPLAAQDGDWPRTLTDGLGSEVTIAAPPQHILSLTLAVDEVLLPALGPERFVAVTGFAHDPAISNVAVPASAVQGSVMSSEDIELIISLEPDLVLVASFTAPEVIQQLRDAGLTVFATGYAVGIDEVRDNVRLLAQVVGEEAAFEAQIERMDADIAAVGAAVGGVDEPARALYLTPGSYTSGANSTIAEIIQAAGGVDVAAEMGMDQMSPLSDEFIIEQDPDVILLTGWTPWDPTFVESFYENPAFAGLSAVQNDRVYVTHDAHLTTTSQFIAEGVKDVAAYLYPDRYPAYPLSVTDASGARVEIGAVPETVAVLGTGALDAVAAILDPEVLAAEVTTLESADGVAVLAGPILLLASPLDAEFTAPEGVTVVRLYEGTTDAERVANLLLVGQALGERAAALNAMAQPADMLAQ